MATAQDRFKAMLAEEFAPWLAQRRFHRHGLAFRRRREGAWQIIDFQRDKYSTARRVRFTINIGISLAIVQNEPAWQSRGWPLSSQCDLRERAGQIHKGQDTWWSVRPLWPVGGVVQDVLAALETTVRWADAHAEPRTFLSYALREGTMTNPMQTLALARLIGEPDDIAAALARCSRSPS